MMPDQQERVAMGEVVTGPWPQPGAEDEQIVDAELVDEPQVSRPRRARGVVEVGRTAFGQLRARLDSEQVRQRTQRVREELALLADGRRHRRALARRDPDQEFLAQFHVDGDLDKPVIPERMSDYRWAVERIEKRRAAEAARREQASDLERAAEWAAQHGKGITGATAGGTVLLDLAGGGMPHWLTLSAAAVGAGMLAHTTRDLRKAGREYRRELARRAEEQARARLGQDDDADLAADVTDLGADEMTELFRDAGILRRPTSNDPGQRVALLEPVADDGQSWIARIALPATVTIAKVRAKVVELAGVLDTTRRHVSITPGASEKRMVLRVFRELPFTGAPVPHPLLGGGRVNLWEQGITVGLDIEGCPVRVDLAKGVHGLVVASSGNGKTVHLVNMLISAMFDRTSELAVFDGKAEGGFDAFAEAGLLDWYIDTDQDEWHDLLAEQLDWEVDNARSRQQRIRRGEDLGVRLLIFDEFQMATGNSSSGGMKAGSIKKRIRDALAALSRLGRTARVRFVLASQSYNGHTIEDETLNNVGWRIVGYADSEMSRDALGETAKVHGVDTSELFKSGDQAGAAVVISPGIVTYATARGWHQGRADIAAAASQAADLRPHRDTAAMPAARTTSSQRPVPGADLDERGGLDEDERALLVAVEDVYAAVDDDWVPTRTLMREIAVGELGWTDDPEDRRVQMRVADILTRHGAVKQRARELEGQPMAWRTDSLLQAASQAA